MFKNDALDDVSLKLLDQNVIALSGDVEIDMAFHVREALLRLMGRGSPPVEIFITSRGGNVDVGLDIYDIMRLYPGETTAIVYGCAYSMASIILQACKKRLAVRHSHILIHHVAKTQISLDTFRNPKKIVKEHEFLERKQALLYEILAERTHHSVKKIKIECAKNREMTAEEALKFGLLDGVL